MAKKGLPLFFRVAVGLPLLLSAFFLPAGSFDWPEAWIFLAGYLLCLGGGILWMKRHDPELLRERMESKSRPGTRKWDRLILALYGNLLLALVVLSGLDRVRYGWSKVPLGLRVAALLLMVFPASLILRCLRHNRFLSDRVRIQAERGHTVCSTGPYARIRHPMYRGVIEELLLLAPALGSFWGLLPGFLAALLFVIRTRLEDETLKRELPGYREYARAVPYRLLRGVW